MFRSLPLVPIDRFADIEAYSRLSAQGVDQVVVWGDDSSSASAGCAIVLARLVCDASRGLVT